MNTTMYNWQHGPANPQLPRHEVHVWRIELGVSGNISSARDLLSADELARVDRYLVEPPRRRLILTRAATRIILSRYTGIAPRDLVFTAGPHGKPHIEGCPIRFNLSHSENLGLLAVTREMEVGVDIEHIDPRRAGNDIATRFFTPAEQQQLGRYTNDERITAFFRAWSRKEAVIKALGEGLACPLDSFDVSLDPHDAHLLELRRENADVAAWNMINIDADPGYAAACAAMGRLDCAVGYHYSAF